MARKLADLPDILAQAYRQGEVGLKEIAQRTGCSVTGARRLLIRAGVPRKRPGCPSGPRDPARLAAMRQLRSQGWTIQAIGHAYGLTKQRVQQLLARF